MIAPASGRPDVWWIDRAVQARRSGRFAPDDVEAAARIGDERRRERFLLARRAVREILAAYIGGAPNDLALHNSADGKPSLAGATGLNFSLSHASHWTLLAVAAEGCVGVDAVFDAEFANDGEAALSTIVTRTEARALSTMDQSARRRLWAAKEAVGKALGRGVLEDLSAIEIGFDARTVARSIVTPAGLLAVMDCPAPAGLTAALCASPPLDGLVLR